MLLRDTAPVGFPLLQAKKAAEQRWDGEPGWLGTARVALGGRWHHLGVPSPALMELLGAEPGREAVGRVHQVHLGDHHPGWLGTTAQGPAAEDRGQCDVMGHGLRARGTLRFWGWWCWQRGGWAGAVSPAWANLPDMPFPPTAPPALPAVLPTRGPKRKKKKKKTNQPRPARQETSNQGQCF